MIQRPLNHPLTGPLALVAALGLAGCMQAGASGAEAAPGAAAAEQVPPGRVSGAAVSCIDTRRVQRTRVYGDDTVDFVMGGSTVYRNALPQRCYSLGFEQRFAYRTPTGQLCSGDPITVLMGDGSQGTTCALGQFLPIELRRE